MATRRDSLFSFFDLFQSRGSRHGPADQSGFLFVEQASGTRSGETVNVDNLLEEATVATCVTAIVQGITQIPVQVRKELDDGTYEVMRKHPIARLMKKPNDYQTATEFKSSIVTTMLIHGNAFIKIIRTGNGKPVQLYPLDPSDITIGSDALGRPKYHHETYGGIDTKDMIHVRDLTVFEATGCSRALLAAERIGALKAADRLMSETFRYGVSMNYVVETEGTLDVEHKKHLSEQLQGAFGKGGRNRGGIALIENGSMSALKGTTPADADLRELREMLIREIAAIFRVPEMMAGGTGDQKYNNVRQYWAAFHRDTLQPIVTNIEEAFTLKLLGDDVALHFDIAELLKGDVETTARIAQTNVSNGVWTPNEGRRYIGTAPHDSEVADQLIAPNSTTNTNVEGGEDAVGTDPANPSDATGGEDGPQGGDTNDE